MIEPIGNICLCIYYIYTYSFVLINVLSNIIFVYRTELKLENPNIPTRLPLLALPDSKTEQYLNFAPSDRKTDAAQNTIPFLDVQSVESNPPIPIAGAGIFHKGRLGSGGYVALRLITYDFSKHLQVDLPVNVETVVDAPNEIRSV